MRLENWGGVNVGQWDLRSVILPQPNKTMTAKGNHPDRDTGDDGDDDREFLGGSIGLRRESRGSGFKSGGVIQGKKQSGDHDFDIHFTKHSGSVLKPIAGQKQ